jgi:hypothetical protein
MSIPGNVDTGKCRYALHILRFLTTTIQSQTSHMPTDVSTPIVSAPITAADVERRLNQCAVVGTAPKMYRVTRVIEIIEGAKPTIAQNRWTSIKKRVGDLATFKFGGNVCVGEADLDKILLLTKECESKTLALSSRGHVIDDAKVRQITLHAGEKKLSIQVDYLTQRLPINEMLQIFEFSEAAAEKILVRLKTTHPELVAAIGDPMKINGFGKSKFCADLKTTMLILWMLPPNERVVAFRSKCVDDIMRQMKGDLSLIGEIENNHAVLEDTGGLHFHESVAPVAEAIPAEPSAEPSDEPSDEAPVPMDIDHEIESAEMVAFRLDERKRRLSLEESKESRRVVQFDDAHRVCAQKLKFSMELHQATMAQLLETNIANVSHQMAMWKLEEAHAEQRMSLESAAAKQRMSFDFEAGIATAMTTNASVTAERHEALERLGTTGDMARFSLADSMLKYTPRKYCYSGAHARTDGIGPDGVEPTETTAHQAEQQAKLVADAAAAKEAIDAAKEKEDQEAAERCTDKARQALIALEKKAAAQAVKDANDTTRDERDALLSAALVAAQLQTPQKQQKPLIHYRLLD